MEILAAHKSNTAWVDQYGRQKRKLRISVTDRCNFKCVYCMPEHPEWAKKHDLLSFEELFLFCKLMVENGIEYIRITGGEPLMRQGVVHFIAELQQLRALGLKRISMTTNAHYLAKHAQALKSAGLDDLNISLDSLSKFTFKNLTNKNIEPVLEGIHAAKQVNLPFKINTVLIKGLNDQDIIPIMQWAITNKVVLRFIEFMPLDGDNNWSKSHVVSEKEILETLSTSFRIQETHTQNAEPARQYFADGQSFGIISTITHSFCGSCDRLRLTAKGEFYNCLFATQSISIKQHIKTLTSNDSQDFINLLKNYIWSKKSGFSEISAQTQTRKISMHMLGG